MADAVQVMEKRRTSKTSVPAFCEAEGITPSIFFYWQKRLREKEKSETSKIFPVCIEKTFQDTTIMNESLELTYPNGVSIILPNNCGLDLIRKLIFIL